MVDRCRPLDSRVLRVIGALQHFPVALLVILFRGVSACFCLLARISCPLEPVQFSATMLLSRQHFSTVQATHFIGVWCYSDGGGLNTDESGGLHEAGASKGVCRGKSVTAVHCLLQRMQRNCVSYKIACLTSSVRLRKPCALHLSGNFIYTVFTLVFFASS